VTPIATRSRTPKARVPAESAGKSERQADEDDHGREEMEPKKLTSQ